MHKLFLLFTVAALGLGCGPGPDPALGPCGERKDGAVIIGTGEDEFTAIPSAGVVINHGSQGGEHIWIGLSCKNLGPKVTARLKITDVESGIEMTQRGLAVAVDLEYDGKGSDLGYGIFGYLDFSGFCPGPSGAGGGGAGGAGGNGGTGGSGGSGGSGGDVNCPNDYSGRKIKIEADVADDCKKPAIHAETTTTLASN
jgi:hypothetical protein